MRPVCAGLLVVTALAAGAAAQEGRVTYDHLVRAADDPGNWLMYSGQYHSQRFSRLDEIDRANVGRLELAWVRQLPTLGQVQTSPLVVDGIMYLTTPDNEVYALDAATGHVFWTYTHDLADTLTLCCSKQSRGVAMLGDRLYMTTLDARLVALDAATGTRLWDRQIADNLAGYSMTAAPLVVKDMVVTGTGGGEYGIRGWVDAYDAATGERRWRAYTIPGPGEPGNETWAGDSWQTGGASTWMTGSYDPDLNLIYWGVGNPGPDWNGATREGDNLYSDSVIAIDADTGAIEWHFQFTPHDVHDWDACQVPVLVDRVVGGRVQKLMLFANRNGFFYVLDRETGRFLLAREYATQTWAQGIDDSGRPIRVPDMEPTPEGRFVYPGSQRRLQLVVAVVQPRHRPLLHDGVRRRGHLLLGRRGLRAGQALRRRRLLARRTRRHLRQRRAGHRPADRPRRLGAPRTAQVDVGGHDDGRLARLRRHRDRQLHRA